MENSRVMKAGDGPNSYFRNSKIQGNAIDQTKSLLIDGIIDLLELQKDLKVFSIADLGCSVGPNTFKSVDAIIDAVKHKCGTEDSVPEFHVFFNDLVGNDFNTLFNALPHDRQYMVAGVPGSFHGRLFPKSSINLMNSSAAVHWLSKVPEVVSARDSPLYNKGRITYARSSSQIVEAFRTQFYCDMKDFFNARSEELVPGGILAILMPCRPQGTSPSESMSIRVTECLGDTLVDMANEGIINEDLIDSFNLPLFFPMASEMEEIVTSSENQFIIEKLVEQPVAINLITYDKDQYSSQMRAVVESVFCQRFSPQVVDELFRRYPEKLRNLVEIPHFAQTQNWRKLFILLKRRGLSP
ncbi:OLC1v1000907C1 [Oldenlandia corymbosa var. corymbosa]|uniref:OLC1v1000907C1 n=1 Tax=Oldenlandia corymbosa var. corymbosa TaxID=529605 RepID=A0AAV1D429_OLDCO|nr:OLC1v1000907C1 [Oldenlandia corymbosa var. corymbosa]